MTRVFDWNGKDVPAELKKLPPGRYVLEPLDDALTLSEEEARGIEDAVRSLDAGKGRSLAQVKRTLARSNRPASR